MHIKFLEFYASPGFLRACMFFIRRQWRKLMRLSFLMFIGDFLAIVILQSLEEHGLREVHEVLFDK